ncbi:CHAD domain containing protein [Pseudonocardia dioxanivorans CB1190]|uniref:CHAD domain containing protein n=1 Tax=Pseudonocardia dioxanivorans (strain ATCC 55486 / DSM 44775 / JCM 13855 / CB1190) TaxID=675635 RepID=F4CND5_PSEUX|nr:CHAD domain-containing protein [Pseudonocardia dioxanivorans]AEA27159.1 CHAD domain containing protein [Pseudonocardia dioxanivorans CB1190]
MGTAADTSATAVRTFRAPAGAGAPGLTGLRGVSVSAEPAVVTETQRYDTDDLRLAAAGIRLELASEPGAAQWRLTLPGEDDVIRLPATPPDVEGADPHEPPGELDELVRGVRRDRPLRPVARVRRVRTTTRLLASGSPRAALDREEVSVATLGDSTTVDTWTEFTLYPPARGGVLAAELERRLADVGAEPAEPAAQDRLDELLAPARPRRVRRGKKGTAGAVLVDHLARQVDTLATQDIRVRRDEDDAVHQMRIAARRLRSALQAYRPLLDRARTDPLVDGLRELGRTLAPARDAEVLRKRISDAIDELDPALVLGPVQAQVARHFARVEAEARAAVLAELDGPGYAAMRTALDDLLADPPLSARARRPAKKELPKVAARSARRLEKAVAHMRADPVDEAIHRVRKDAKRLRYATEVARPAVPGKQVARFAKGLKGMQKALGEHQDSVVARTVLRELGAQAHAGGDNGFTFGLLYGRDQAAATLVEAQLPGLWDTAWKKKARRWLR